MLFFPQMQIMLFFGDLFLKANCAATITKLGHTVSASLDADLIVVDLEHFSGDNRLMGKNVLGFYSHKNVAAFRVGKLAGFTVVTRGNLHKTLVEMLNKSS